MRFFLSFISKSPSEFAAKRGAWGRTAIIKITSTIRAAPEHRPTPRPAAAASKSRAIHHPGAAARHKSPWAAEIVEFVEGRRRRKIRPELLHLLAVAEIGRGRRPVRVHVHHRHRRSIQHRRRALHILLVLHQRHNIPRRAVHAITSRIQI